MCPEASASQQLLRSVLWQKEKRSLNLPSLLLSVAVSPVGNEVWYRYMGVTCSGNRRHIENLCPRLPNIWRKTKKLFSTESSTCRLVVGRDLPCQPRQDPGVPVTAPSLTAAHLPQALGWVCGCWLGPGIIAFGRSTVGTPRQLGKGRKAEPREPGQCLRAQC